MNTSLTSTDPATVSTPSPAATLPAVIVSPDGTEISQFPADPNLSFNIYADDLLDDLFTRLVLPFRRHLQMEQRSSIIWAVRYSRRGHHLKLRFHLQEKDVARAEELLRELTEQYFNQLDTLPAVEHRTHLDRIPAIDPEDEAEGLVDDHTLLKTHYRRGFVNLGGEPFLSLDDYALHMAQGLGAGLNFFLDILERTVDLASTWRPNGSFRQKMLLKVLLVGIHATRQNREELQKYLEFHRDCLLRFYVPDLEEEQGTREVFDQQVAKSPVNSLRTLAAAEAGRDLDAPGEGTAGEWRRSVTELWDYLTPFGDDPDFMTHPFAEHVAWAPLFKVFHGMANQIGMAPLKEAYLHHLLAQVLAVDSTAPQTLKEAK